MKFAHLADCHVGSWRDPKLNNISTQAFQKAIDLCIKKKVDFILIAGDLFNTSVPGIDKLKDITKKLKEVKDQNIPIYLIAGSHDFSPSGKTMLDVLENAGLCTNVTKGTVEDNILKLKFTIDKKTNVKITGLLGKRGGLEKNYYEELEKENLENEDGFKIFMFHSLLTELKPKDLEKSDSQPLSFLPKNFNYYAGGHPHFIFNKTEQNYGLIAYPGPLFPNNFSELEKLENGGFYIYEDGKLTWEPIRVYNTHSIKLDCSHKTPDQIDKELLSEIKGKEFINTIITIRLFGTLETGRPSDINFRDIIQKLYDKGAYFIMKNTNALQSKDFEEIKIDASTVDDVEKRIIDEHLTNNITDEKKITNDLIRILSICKDEGEKVADFEKRIKEEVGKILRLPVNL
ncbi:MAG: DNA repair exonuclease [Nanoarchaeota archaeon]